MKKVIFFFAAFFMILVIVSNAKATVNLTITDGGRRLQSDVPFLVEPHKVPPEQCDFKKHKDCDGDGVLQEFENAVLERLNPKIELDEEESWLKNRDVDKVVNFGRVTVYPSRDYPKYLLVHFAVTWSRDYGRATLPGRGPGIDEYNKIIATKHNGDVERITQAWEIIDNRTAELKWVYLSAHGDETRHSGIWNAKGESCNTGKVKLGPDQKLCSTLQFEDGRVKIQASEGKHALYPTAQLCEDVRLVATIGEDCGGGGTHIFPVYNAGEPDERYRLMDDVGHIFPGEKIWSAQEFCGSKTTRTYNKALPCVGKIGNALEDPEEGSMMRERLDADLTPAGTYKQSCNTIKYDSKADRVTAHCKRISGSWNPSASASHTRECLKQGGDIANCDGNIDCINVNLPNVGSYKQSCWCCRMDGTTLRCHCNKKGKGSKWTSLENAHSYKDIWNDDGTLKGELPPREAKEDEVIFFEHVNYGGSWIGAKIGSQYPSLGISDGKNWNDTISSMKVGKKAKVTVYEHVNFGGAHFTVKGNCNTPLYISNLKESGWNDKISSFKIEQNYDCK